MDPVFESRLRQALTLELDYPERALLNQRNGQPSAVLALWAMKDSKPSLLLTKRTETVETHKGQVAFPGGRSEADELGPGGAERTALRETFEEVGIPPEAVKVLGQLPGMWTVSNYWIHPFVGVLNSRAEEVKLQADPRETAETWWVTLEELLSPGVYRLEKRLVGPIEWPIHVYQVGPHRVWGATGAMIKNLLDRLERVGA